MFAVLLASSIAASGAIAAPFQWSAGMGGNDHWYEIVFETVATWQGAAAAAAASTHLGLSGYLATITSAAEQAFLNSLNPDNLTLWLGGTDAANEGEWVWATEPGGPIPFDYTNWAWSEPNNYGNEDYLLGWWVGDQWNDIRPEYSSYGYVIEYSPRPGDEPGPSPIPLPAGLTLLALGLGALGAASRGRRRG